MCVTVRVQKVFTPQGVPFCSLPTIATNTMKKLMPDVEIHRIPLGEAVFGSKLGLGLQTGPCHFY